MQIKSVIDRILQFIKNETVLSISVILAIVSSFFVKPDMDYLGYIDFRTLSLLFCLMAVMAGFQKSGVFKVMAEKLLDRIKTTRSLVFILVMLCFFFSMLITNDVALITFVPFTIIVLNLLGGQNKDKMLIRTVVMQTVAANLGSMLTPIGNPQNLYLHGISQMAIGKFIYLMLPYTAVSFLMLTAWALFLNKKSNIEIKLDNKTTITEKTKVFVYALLFLCCIFTVARVIDYRITLAVVIAVIALVNRSIFRSVDYTLLATFLAFFIFIGNMGRVDAFKSFLESVIAGHECMVGILSSQVISNVPAALLLSGFTDNYDPLIVGVNIGGLGTLIASMASLISFKFVGRENKALRGRYLLYFTAVNIIFLAVLAGAFGILK